MRIRYVILIACILVIAAFVGRGRDSVPGLDAPEQLTLYSIDGRYRVPDDKEKAETPGLENTTGEWFHDFPVFGKVEITDSKKRRQIASALKKSLARSDGTMAACFWPRHAIRTVEKGQTIDFVICFECYQLEAHQGSSKSVKPVTREPQPVFNKHLDEAGLPLAPGMDAENK